VGCAAHWSYIADYSYVSRSAYVLTYEQCVPDLVRGICREKQREVMNTLSQEVGLQVEI
jgi:hypothetical protein